MAFVLKGPLCQHRSPGRKVSHRKVWKASWKVSRKVSVRGLIKRSRRRCPGRSIPEGPSRKISPQGVAGRSRRRSPRKSPRKVSRNCRKVSPEGLPEDLCGRSPGRFLEIPEDRPQGLTGRSSERKVSPEVSQKVSAQGLP